MECSLVVMTDRDDDLTCDESIPALVSAALLTHDLRDATDNDIFAATQEVNDSVRAMPDFTRFGVTVAAGAVYGALSVMGRKPFRRQPPERRSELATTLMGVRLPILGEFGTLTRGLGLVRVYESRAVRADDSGEEPHAAAR